VSRGDGPERFDLQPEKMYSDPLLLQRRTWSGQPCGPPLLPVVARDMLRADSWIDCKIRSLSGRVAPDKVVDKCWTFR